MQYFTTVPASHVVPTGKWTAHYWVKQLSLRNDWHVPNIPSYKICSSVGQKKSHNGSRDLMKSQISQSCFETQENYDFISAPEICTVSITLRIWKVIFMVQVLPESSYGSDRNIHRAAAGCWLKALTFTCDVLTDDFLKWTLAHFGTLVVLCVWGWASRCTPAHSLVAAYRGLDPGARSGPFGGLPPPKKKHERNDLSDLGRNQLNLDTFWQIV